MELSEQFSQPSFEGMQPPVPSAPRSTDPQPKISKRYPYGKDQLQMLMMPSEIRRQLVGMADVDDFTDKSEVKDIMDTKLHESKFIDEHERDTIFRPSHDTLFDSIKKHGVQRHIVLVPKDNGFLLGNGHHRFAVAEHLARRGHKMHIPVIHDSDFMFNQKPEYDDMYGLSKEGPSRAEEPEKDWWDQ